VMGSRERKANVFARIANRITKKNLTLALVGIVLTGAVALISITYTIKNHCSIRRVTGLSAGGLYAGNRFSLGLPYNTRGHYQLIGRSFDNIGTKEIFIRSVSVIGLTGGAKATKVKIWLRPPKPKKPEIMSGTNWPGYQWILKLPEHDVAVPPNWSVNVLYGVTSNAKPGVSGHIWGLNVIFSKRIGNTYEWRLPYEINVVSCDPKKETLCM